MSRISFLILRLWGLWHGSGPNQSKRRRRGAHCLPRFIQWCCANASFPCALTTWICLRSCIPCYFSAWPGLGIHFVPENVGLLDELPYCSLARLLSQRALEPYVLFRLAAENVLASSKLLAFPSWCVFAAARTFKSNCRICWPACPFILQAIFKFLRSDCGWSLISSSWKRRSKNSSTFRIKIILLHIAKLTLTRNFFKTSLLIVENRNLPTDENYWNFRLQWSKVIDIGVIELI